MGTGTWKYIPKKKPKTGLGCVMPQQASCIRKTKSSELDIVSEEKVFRRKVKYLEHIISTDGIRTDPEKTEAVNSRPVPIDKPEVRSFASAHTNVGP